MPGRQSSSVRGRFAWLATRAERTSRLQRFRRYWVWRQRREALEFKLYARLLDARRSVRERAASAGALGTIARTVLVSLAGAIVLAVALELLDRLVFQRASVLRTFLPNGFADRTARRFHGGAHAGELTLFGTIAQIAGIFLGLYFAAVSGIAAAVYADVPGEVRLLLTREKLGNVYIKIVAFLGAFALVLSTAVVLGIGIGLASVAVVGVLSALSIFAFVILGLRAFYFFSPDTLAGYVINDVVPLFQASRRGRFGSKSRAIPYNYQRQAEDLLSTFRAVVSLSATRASVTERSLLRIVEGNLRLLYLYESLKGDIDSKSLWFKQRLEFPNWLTADHSSVEIALQTQTAIQGKPVSDRLWVERELQDVFRLVLKALLDRTDRAKAIEAFELVVSWTRLFGRQLAIEETLAMCALAKGLIEENLASRSQGDRSVESIALADCLATLPMQVVLGMSDRLRPLTADAFVKATSGVDPLSPLSGAWPTEVVEQREYIAERLGNERLVERKRLTADWYISQVLALSMSRFFARVVPRLLAELETLPTMATARLDQGQTILAAAIVQRGLESCQKFSVHLGEFSDSLERIAALRKAGDIPWVETDWEDAQRRVGEVRTQLLLLIARIAVEVSSLETGGEIPDFFGAAYAFLAEECFEDSVHGRADKFQRLYPAFFSASLSANERLNRQLADYDQRTQILFSTETLEDLLEISGYALLKRELGEGQCWAVVKDLWDRYLANRDRTQFFTFLFAVLSYRGSVFGIKPRDIGRTSWRMAFQRYLVEGGHVRSRYGGLADIDFDLDLNDEDVQIASPLLRVAGSGLTGQGAAQAFVVEYLLAWPEAQGLDLPRETQRFQGSLAFYNRDRVLEDLDADDDVPPPENAPADPPEEDGAAGDEHDDVGGTDA
jgi:hypothetical protein